MVAIVGECVMADESALSLPELEDRIAILATIFGS